MGVPGITIYHVKSHLQVNFLFNETGIKSSIVGL